MNKVNDSLQKYEALTEYDRATIKESIAGLSKSIEGSPKSMKSKMRAKIRLSKRWYNEVTDWEAQYSYAL